MEDAAGETVEEIAAAETELVESRATLSFGVEDAEEAKVSLLLLLLLAPLLALLFVCAARKAS